MIKDENNNYLNIKIPEKLEKFLIALGFLRSAKVIELIFSILNEVIVIRSIFKIDELEKSLKELTRKIKLAIPNLTSVDQNLIEQGILGIVYLLEDPELENNIKDQLDKQMESGPDIAFNEWLDKLVEKYGYLEYTISKHFPEIWQVIEFILSVKNILHINNNTLPFAGFVLGPASSSKTLGLVMLRKLEMTFYTDSFTPRSFVSHNNSVTRANIQEIDLLPKIKNKLFITPELAPILSTKDDELVQLIAIITRILDGQGYESDSGSLGHRGYREDIMFTWIGAAVEIPRKVHKHLAFLGPKLYFFRMETIGKTEEEYVYELKYGNFHKSKKEVEEALLDYIQWFGYYPIRDKDCELFKIEFDHSKDDDNAITCIVKLAKLLSHLRSVAQTWETRDTQGSDYGYSIPTNEYPKRAQTSLNNLAAGHALIYGRTSITMDDIPIIVKTVLSTAPIERVKIFDLLINSKGRLHSSDIIKFLGTSRTTTLRTMTELKVIGLVDLEKESEAINSPFIITLKNEFRWFLSEEFRELRQGFIPKEFEQKEKVPKSKTGISISKGETGESKECEEKILPSDKVSSLYENNENEIKMCEEKIPPSEPEKFFEESQEMLSFFWYVYGDLEKDSEDINEKGTPKVNHERLVYILTMRVCGCDEMFTIGSVEALITKLVEEGHLIVEGSDSYSKSTITFE